MKASFISLPELQKRLTGLANDLLTENVPVRLRDLRDHHQKKTRELHQAAVFARGIQAALEIAPHEMMVGIPDDEYCVFDAILLWKKDGEIRRLDVQLKELPPAYLPSTTSIEQIIAKAVARLGRAPDVVLAIFLNKPVPLNSVGVPYHGLAGFFIFGVAGSIPPTVFVCGHLGGRRIEATVPLRLESQQPNI